MDQEVLVRERTDSAGRVLLKLQDKFPVRVGFLIAMYDSETPMMYVVLDDPSLSNSVYREILQIAKESPDPNFDPFSVTVVGDDDPMAQSALEFIARHGTTFSTNTSGHVFGQPGVSRVYIFASPLTPTHVG